MSRQKNGDETKIILIKKHNTLMEQLINLHNIKEELREDVKASMVLAILQAYDKYGEAYECMLNEILCKALTQCLRDFSHCGVEYEKEPYYYDKKLEECELFGTVRDQAERTARITAAVGQLSTVSVK